MKKLKYLLLLLIISMLGVNKVFAKSNPYPHYENLGFGDIVNCTWYAWEETKNRTGIELPTWYNVWTWHTKAASSGFSTGKEPRANSLMIWNYGEGFGGHVAYVTAVNGSTITYDEGGAINSTGIATNQTITIEEVKMITTDYGFIYLDVPRVTTTKATTTKTPTTKAPTTTTNLTTTTTTTTSEIISTTIQSTTSTTEKVKESETTKKVKEKIIKSTNSKDYIIILGSMLVVISLIILIIRIVKRK